MWHEIAKEGYPPNFDENYLITDGEDYFIGNWREDAKAWDNYNMGWVRKYITGEINDESLVKATHWMELPALPKDCVNTEQLYDEFKAYVKNMTGKELKESRDRATTTVEELFGGVRDTTEHELIDAKEIQ